MNSKIYIPSSVMLAALLGVASAVQASAGCGPALSHSYEEVQAVIDSLHADKPGQMRVQAKDGSIYTGGEARWLKGQLQDMRAACERGQPDVAERHLRGIRQDMEARHAAT